MDKPYLFYAWQLSLYSGKTRAYLRYKAIPHKECPVRFWDLKRIKEKVGAQVMPVVVTPEGEWLQDTSHIIDVLERRHPLAPVVPESPRQRIAAYLLEAWGDEFWLPSAMHYRWSFPENFTQCFQREGGDDLMPFAPRFIKNKLIARGAAQMRGFLDGLGVVPSQLPLIERWTLRQLDVLESHFSQYPYLLGSKPSIGDFGLIAPLYAHLGRDPYPARELMTGRPHLRGWIRRMQQPEHPTGGAFLAGDVVPATLTPLFDSIFKEFWPQLTATLTAVQQALPKLAAGRGFRRQLDAIEIPLAGKRFTLSARPYSLWMAQRVLDSYRALTSGQQGAVQAWLATVGGDDAMQLDIRPRLERRALHVMPDPGAIS